LDSVDAVFAAAGTGTSVGLNVGSGKTLSVAGTLSVTGSATVEFADGSASTPSITNDGDTNTGMFFPAADTIAFAEGGVEAMRLDASGNMGLGVTPTNNTLGKTLQNGQAGAWTAETGTNRWWLGSNWYFNSSDKYINNGHATLYSQQNGTHTFFTSASGTAGNTISFTQAMTLDASGRLIVGATSASGSNQVEIQTGLTNGLWVQTGDTTSSSTIADFRNGSNVSALKIFGNARSTFVSTIGVGEATPSTSGSGITFPATQSASSNANTLDDYEEGSWTPIIGGTEGASGQTYASQTGKYTKIGNLVWATGAFTLTAKGTFSGAYVCITGLPFAGIEVDGQISVGYFGNLNANKVFVGGYTSGSLIVLTANSAASSSLTVSGFGQADIANNTYISFTVVYKTS
jgi:hypothetical protein